MELIYCRIPENYLVGEVRELKQEYYKTFKEWNILEFNRCRSYNKDRTGKLSKHLDLCNSLQINFTIKETYNRAMIYILIKD